MIWIHWWASMFYKEYAQDRYLRKTLRQRFEKQKQKEDCPVTFRDMVIYPEHAEYSYGESKQHTNSRDENADIRLIDHIQYLAKLANSYHQKAYCEPGEEGRPKKEYLNTITRLSLPEFSLYGKKPMTLAEFSEFIGKFEEIALNSHDNVHLLMSSISVVDDNNKLLNISIYMQGGSKAKINIVTKGAASNIDVGYENTTLFAQQIPGKKTLVVSHYIAGDKKGMGLISNNSVFEVETLGGARYTQTIDVCLDHRNEHSKRLMTGTLDSKKVNTDKFIPNQVDQVLSANSTDIKPSAKITSHVLHVDPRPLQFVEKEEAYNLFEHLDKDAPSLLSEEDIAMPKYSSTMKVKKVAGQLRVTNPPFGSDFRVNICKERILGSYNPQIAAKVQKANQMIMDERIEDHISARYADKKRLVAYHQLETWEAKAITSADQLIHRLKQQAKLNIFETNPLKEEVQGLLYIYENSLNGIKKDDPADRLPNVLAWAKDLQNDLANLKESALASVLPSFLSKLVSSIDQFKDKINSEAPPDLRA